MKKSLILFAVALFTFLQCEKRTTLYEQLGLEEITIPQIQQAYETGRFSAVQLTQAYLERIEAIDKKGP